MQGVAHQHEIAGMPALVFHNRKIQPAQKLVGQQHLPLQRLRKHLRQIGACISLAHLVQTRPQPSLRRALHHKRTTGTVQRRICRNKAVRMGDKDAGRVLAKIHCQPVEYLRSAQPNILVLPQINRWQKQIFIVFAKHTIGAVRTHEQVTLTQRRQLLRCDIGLVAQINPKLKTAPLQDIQE